MLTPRDLQRPFDDATPLTVGIEEEVMLLDPGTLDLTACASAVLERLAGDPRFKRELPASQVEIATVPAATAADAIAQLARARRDLAAACEGLAHPAVAGVHPFATAEGALSTGKRYAGIEATYGTVARRQLVASLQVHVAVGGAARTLAVYGALRCHLPEIAALAANAAFHEGRDTGLASVRPTIAGTLPRQGVPPPLESWERFAEELRWGAAAGTVADPRTWWWELRPHPAFGTLEVRVPDAQTGLADAAGVVAFVHALVAALAERWDAGEPLPAAPTWRIEENRWAALRHGVEGTLADLDSGERIPTRARLARLIDELEPAGGRRRARRAGPHALAGRALRRGAAA
jgi:carboxylate-amine ligase